MNFEQLKQLDGLSSDRADIIVPALEVFTTLMDSCRNDKLPTK